ncbi:MAG: LuxR C-terminal-related transcriptional regulator [Planctomycetota bacterium]
MNVSQHDRGSIDEFLYTLFAEDPGTGFALVDSRGVITFANARAAHMFLRCPPEEVIGRSTIELFGEQWGQERMRILELILETGTPVISRHIRHGVQIQSTVRLLTDQDDENPTFLVLSVEGEHDPADPEQFEIVESKIVHLGPLGSLTKREIEVLALIGHGMTTNQIGNALHRSPRTIERHCDSIRVKLDGATRVQMAEFARRAGLRTDHSEHDRV